MCSHAACHAAAPRSWLARFRAVSSHSLSRATSLASAEEGGSRVVVVDLGPSNEPRRTSAFSRLMNSSGVGLMRFLRVLVVGMAVAAAGACNDDEITNTTPPPLAGVR